MGNSFIKISILSIFVFFTSCKNGSEKKEIEIIKKSEELTKFNKSSQNLNISFLLDLSDRIDPKKYPNESMEYYARDAAYIKSVSEAFDAHLRGKKVRNMNDKIQLYFDPEPQNQNINKISNDLQYVVNRDNVTLERLDELKSNYAVKPLEIYDLAITDHKYVGSDTWRFFKDKVTDYCIEDEHRNILIVLTDGYIYHEDTKIKEANKRSYLVPRVIKDLQLNTKNWEKTMKEKNIGFISTGVDLSNLEVLVLGINPSKNNPYEQDVVMKFWNDWLDDMNVKKKEIKTAELPSNMDKIIKNFINN